MIRKTTWVLVVIFAVLLGSVWFIPWWQGRNPQPAPTASATAHPILPGAIVQLTVSGSGGMKVVTEKSPDPGKWNVLEPTGLVFDPTKVQDAISFMQGAKIQTELSTQPPIDAVGLAEPKNIIIAKLDNGSEVVLNVGNSTPTGSGYYAQIPGQPMFIISKGDIDPAIGLLTAGVPPVTPSTTPRTHSPGSGTGTIELPTVTTPTP